MPLSPLAYVVILTYGLTRRRLLNLQLVIREGAVAALGSLFLTVTVALVILGGVKALNVPVGLDALYCAALLFALLYPLQQHWTRILLGRWLGKEVNLRQSLLDYSLLSSAHPSFDDLIHATLERLVQEHGLGRAGVLLPKQGGVLSVFDAFPRDSIPNARLESVGTVADALLAAPQGLDLDSLGWTRLYEKKPKAPGDEEAVRAFLDSTRAQACFGLVLRGRVRGMLLVGAPEAGRALTPRELDFFAALAGQLAGMLENASLEGQVQHADRLSTVGLLAASVAHEIRNSLASINVFLALFEKHRGDPAFMEKFDRIIGGEMKKMSRLSDDMMDLARPSTQTRGVVDLGLLCERESLISGHLFRKAQVRLKIQAAPGTLVLADETRLSQVLLNLVLNALDVSSAASTVEVNLLRRQNEAELRVRDHGPGIEQMDQLFQPFYTTKKDGHGLGLATSRRIAESFGGRLDAANAPDGGAEFTLHLPLAPAPPVPRDKARTEPEKAEAKRLEPQQPPNPRSEP